MKFGICANINAKDQWGVGFDAIPMLASLGYDYLELPLMQMVSMPEEAFDEEVAGRLSAANIRCGACNCFLPGSVRLTGGEVSAAQIEEYVGRAMARAARIGAPVVVLGSSGARNVPAGTSVAEGYQQLAHALRIIGPIAARWGIQIAIEPLNPIESNIVNTYMSGLYLAALAAQPNVGTLVDAYHFCLVNEPLADLYACAPTHVHYADLQGRLIPKAPSATGRAFFAALKDSGYNGRVSLEGSIAPGAELSRSAALALDALRTMCD